VYLHGGRKVLEIVVEILAIMTITVGQERLLTKVFPDTVMLSD
jgi:hypothetical protein